ncbi:uncharacterized protein LOC112559745 [Pomacea canaliculata]|uniref:uncharacterized protein LOC112559745 n=1 Tax=Pomacea canaliculata TaxID=400727 RepID=UPI000D728152|nr:uncharacterized protein LOC112559745 [Pomacea canaliculata]
MHSAKKRDSGQLVPVPLRQRLAVCLRSPAREDRRRGFYKELACQVTLDTSGCLGAAMTGCDTNVKRDVLNYYAIFTNETCVANPSVAYTTPTPPRREPEDVVIACAKLIAETLPRSAAPPKDASRVAQVIHGLRDNCRSFEARYNCYDEKLNQIRSPAFRDLWLMSTFSSKNAIKAQKEFCEAFEGGLVNSFTDQCYADAQPSLQECEMAYGEEIVSLQSQWLSRAIDDVGLRKAACNVSLTRATCLGRAFSHCGDRLGKTMETSERGSLPSICLTLLSPPPRESEHDRGDNRAPKAVPEQDGSISSGYSNVNDNSVTSDLGARESIARKQSGNNVSASQSAAGSSAVVMEISVTVLMFAFVLRGALLA